MASSGITVDFDGEGRVELVKKDEDNDGSETVLIKADLDDISAIIYPPFATGRDEYSLNLYAHHIKSDDGPGVYHLGFSVNLDMQQLTTLFYGLGAIIKIERDNTAEEK